jgi:DNA-binding response OmpR family regulator
MLGTANTHILIVEDDTAIASLLCDLLEREGYIVHEARNGEQLRRALMNFPIELVTLDLSLGGEDGLELCRQTRRAYDIPIIMVTGKGDDVDRIVGLEIGADDYIAKPFNIREVLARIRAVLRRSEMVRSNTAKQRISFGEYVLDVSKRKLMKLSGEQIYLTTTEFNLLLVLVQRPGHVFTREALIDALKGDASNSFDRSVDTLVARIRKKIEPNSDNPSIIKTVRGIGYSLM